MILDVFVEGDPVAQPRVKAVAFSGRARVYDPGTAKPWRARIAAALVAKRPERPVDGPVGMSLEFHLRRPKSHYTASGALKRGAPAYPVGRPDIDNLIKAVTDELTQLSIWRDDSQLVGLSALKMYATQRPGMRLAFAPVDRVESELPPDPHGD